MQKSVTRPDRGYTASVQAAQAGSAHRRILAPAQLASHAQRVQFRAEDLSWESPIDRTMRFICPTLTPLYYAPSWNQLSESQQLRYNQLAGLCSNELIGLFERSLQPIFQNLLEAPFLPQDLRALLPGFIADETRHAQIWYQMNQQVEPQWYADGPLSMVKLPAAVRALTGVMTSYPAQFPAVVWIALILEEHSLEITRRTMQCEWPIEPRFLAALRLHAQDEARHVQIDWHVLQHLLDRLSRPMRTLNAWVLRRVVENLLFKPVHVAVRVIERLTTEFGDLKPLLPVLTKELAALAHCQAYRRMIFSREANPMSFEMGLGLEETRPFFQSLV